MFDTELYDRLKYDYLKNEIIKLRSENEELKKLIQQANNYLSGGGWGASVQRAAELWRKLYEETNRRPNS